MEPDHINLISDGEVIDIDDSVITLGDSIDETSGGPAVQSERNLEVEDGEVTTEDEELNLVFTIKFKNKNDFESIHKLVQGALSTALAPENIEIIVSNDDELRLLAHRTVVDTNESDTFNFEGLFQVDTEPAGKLDTELVPSYKRSVKKELNQEAPVPAIDNEDRCERPKNNSGCFNCGSTNHSLRECTKKQNSARIQRAKKQHSSKYERYHVDVEQRFAHIQPGTLSNDTRVALGLKRGELPFMFYRMRVLGYPPAWLEAAQVVDSGIALFNADGTEVQKSDEEVNKHDIARESVKFDITKIVDFPGYNVHPGPRFYDDFRHHCVPAISDLQKKELLIEALGDNILKSYKRRKLKNLPTAHDNEYEISSSVDLKTDDMEIEDSNEATATKIEFTRPMPPDDEPRDDNYKPLAPPPTTPPLEKDSNIDIRGGSPSLEDLQAQQEQLLLQLESNISVSEDVYKKDSTLNDVSLQDSIEENTNEKGAENQLSLKRTANEILTPEHQLSSKHFKATHMGTPVLKFSEFEKLPDGENFKAGVSDVINFENLPDSTGKYEQMKDVIRNVRKTITKLQNEDD